MATEEGRWQRTGHRDSSAANGSVNGILLDLDMECIDQICNLIRKTGAVALSGKTGRKLLLLVGVRTTERRRRQMTAGVERAVG